MACNQIGLSELNPDELDLMDEGDLEKFIDEAFYHSQVGEEEPAIPVIRYGQIQVSKDGCYI